MILVDPARVSLSGEEGDRLALSIRHLQRLNTEELWREFDNPDPIWHWGADYPGRWLATMALLASHTGEDYGVQAVARRLISYQRPDGSYGDFTNPHDYKEWFGMGRGLVGLLEYFFATGDREAFDSAVRLGDYYVANYPLLTPQMYECYSNALEGIVLLARHTGEARFATLAHQMAQTSMVYQRVWHSTVLGENGRRSPCGGQVHCQLMAARGLLDLAEWSREMRYLTPVLELHQHICDKSLSLAGGVGIYFNRPEENEACADADWMRLNLQLWRMTGELQYLELAEQTLLNQIPFSQASNGAYCYLRGLQNRSGNAFDVCCSHHVPRAIWEVMRYAATSEGKAVSINLHLEGRFALHLDGELFEYECARSVDGDDITWTYSIVRAPGTAAAFNVRVPRWAGRSTSTVNGSTVEQMDAPGYHEIDRPWIAGDLIEVCFSYVPRMVSGHRIGRQLMHVDEAALLYGPLVLAISDLHNPEVDIHTARLLVDSNGEPRFSNCTTNRLEAAGVTLEGAPVRLVFSPITETGGHPNGVGRSHPALAAPFRVWIQVQE
jgi:DUF1680 family protein